MNDDLSIADLEVDHFRKRILSVRIRQNEILQIVERRTREKMNVTLHIKLARVTDGQAVIQDQPRLRIRPRKDPVYPAAVISRDCWSIRTTNDRPT